MGLDMYLTKKVYVKNWDHMPKEKQWNITIERDGEAHDFGPIKYLEIDAGYWRKANHIHQWFVKNVQGGEDECREHYVNPEDLEELLKVVNRVREDHSLAEELLPTTSGFFFGGTEYDEWYYGSLDETAEILEKAIADPDHEYYYQSSW